MMISVNRRRPPSYHEPVHSFIEDVFTYQTIVAWIHLRWVWHTTTLSSSSHVVFLEDFQVSMTAYICNIVRYQLCPTETKAGSF